jgi:hypothetical protein
MQQAESSTLAVTKQATARWMADGLVLNLIREIGSLKRQALVFGIKLGHTHVALLGVGPREHDLISGTDGARKAGHSAAFRSADDKRGMQKVSMI